MRRSCDPTTATPGDPAPNPRVRSTARLALAVAPLSMVLAACGGQADQGGSPGADASPGTSSAVPSPAAESPARPAAGGGSASLTVGGDTWDFASALCAFGEEMIGQAGAEFNLSAIQDGLQLYLSIDSYGHSASLKDIEDYENPSVSLDTEFGPSEGSEFIEVNGNQVSGEAEFVDGASDPPQTVPGSFEATCT